MVPMHVCVYEYVCVSVYVFVYVCVGYVVLHGQCKEATTGL